MAETAKLKVRRFQKWRDKRKPKREPSGAKAEAVGKHRKAENEYDEDRMHKIGRGSLFG